MGFILGISAFYHDSAAALIRDGDIVAAAQEERFTRKKHDARFPEHAIRFVLGEAGIKLSEVDYVTFYDKPFLKFERLLETYLAIAPWGFRSFKSSMPVWMREKLFLKRYLLQALQGVDEDFDQKKLLFSEHHLSHAGSAFYPSPFEEAAILTLDGVGEWATSTICTGKGNAIDIHKEIMFPHSLGLLYSAFTQYLGFKVNSGEYKLMGLAPYGTPRYKDKILNHVIDVKPDGSFRLDQSYFNYMGGLSMISAKFADLFGAPALPLNDTSYKEFHLDVAASIQSALDDIVLIITRSMAAEYDTKNLCMAGGVALNCVTNGKILRDGRFKNLWIQPAAGDAGGALGAAMAAHHAHCGQPRSAGGDRMRGSYLGPEFSQRDVEEALSAAGAKYDVLGDAAMLDRTASALAEGKAIGWFQGRMEFGPRALGNRSIIADPRNEAMQKTLNLKIKFRESFRPFAPSVLREDVQDWFELDGDSPYMLLVYDVKQERRKQLPESMRNLSGIAKLNTVRSSIPAVTHVDYSARIQTVHQDTNPRYHALIKKFKEKTGCPVLVNTSFNVRGEPVVCTPEDAFRCFMGTGLDLLVAGNCVLEKTAQPESLKLNYEHEFERD